MGFVAATLSPHGSTHPVTQTDQLCAPNRSSCKHGPPTPQTQARILHPNAIHFKARPPDQRNDQHFIHLH